jgi:hypothetical protein
VGSPQDKSETIFNLLRASYFGFNKPYTYVNQC